MRQISIVLLAAIILVSCKKDNPYNDQFTGTWELERSMTMSGVINFPQGNGRIIYLGPTGVFERREADTTRFRGMYSLENRNDCNQANQTMLTTSESNTEFRIYIEDAKFVLTTSACLADGGIAWYNRIR